MANLITVVKWVIELFIKKFKEKILLTRRPIG